MRATDYLRAYATVRLNGWTHVDATKAAGIVFNAGGFSGLASQSYWPNTFRKLTDPWPLRAGLDPTTVGVDAFWRNSTVQACRGWILRCFTEARIRVVKGEGDAAEEIPNHPLTVLLNRPNEHYTSDLLWEETLDDWWILGRGNAYWLADLDRTGTPVALWPTPAKEFEPIRPKDGSKYLSHYERALNGNKQELSPLAGSGPKLKGARVLHFRFGRDPDNPLKGYIPVAAGGAEVGMLNEGAGYRGELLARHGIVPYALTPKDQETAESMDKDKVEALEKLFRKKFGRGGEGASLFIPNFMADLTRMGFSPQELDIRAMMEWDSSTICALFGLNAMVVGLPSGDGERTYANQEDAREAATETNIVPTQDRFAATIELQLGPSFDLKPDEHVTWDRSGVRVLQPDQNQLWQRFGDAWSKGAITRAHFKQGVDLDVDDSVDQVYFIPSTGALVPADETPEDARAREEEAAAAEAERRQQEIESMGDRAAQQNGNGTGPAAANGNGQGPPAALNGAAGKALALPERVRITEGDVDDSVELFNEAVPEFAGILDAKPVE